MLWLFVFALFLVEVTFGRLFGPAIGLLAVGACFLLALLATGVFLWAQGKYLRLRPAARRTPWPGWQPDRRVGHPPRVTRTSRISEAAIRHYVAARGAR